MRPGNHAHLGEHFFPPTTSLGFPGKVTGFPVKNILEVIMEEGRLRIWEGVFLVPNLGLRSQTAQSCRTS